MTQNELIAIQTPIKERYKRHPNEAAASISATACLKPDIKNMLTIGKHCIETGLHIGAGGNETNICPGEIFLGSIAACSGITLGAVATHMGLDIKNGRITATGFFDLRGTLGMDPAIPVGFKNIELKIDLDTNASAKEIETLLEMTEKYCVVFQTLVSPPKLSVQKWKKQTL